MKYYVVADVHGFLTEMKEALEEAGFFKETEPHKLIICGDVMDRGSEALEMQKFLLELKKKDRVILIRGNHEDLMLDLLAKWHQGSYQEFHHISNGTVDTVCQLTQVKAKELAVCALSVQEAIFHSPFVQSIIPAMIDYYETEHYIFTHGWIPSIPKRVTAYDTAYTYREDWREADAESWKKARWYNGMEAAHTGATEKGKIIVCGHWHCSYGHAYYENKGSEFYADADFSPYYGDGIIALDTCTATTKKVNCIVIED